MHLDFIDLHELTAIQKPIWAKHVGETNPAKIEKASTLDKVKEFIRKNDTPEYQADRGAISEYADPKDEEKRELYQQWDIAKDILYKICYPRDVVIQRRNSESN